jgi:thioredoxin-related protein
MRYYHTTLFALIVLSLAWFTELKAQNNVKFYAIDQVEQVGKKENKKTLIAVFTKWSEGFRQLENDAMKQPHIVNYLNDKFLTVKFDAETRTDVNFHNKVYHYVTQSGVGFNQLASELLQGQMAYPTLVFLDENMDVIQVIQYNSIEQFEMIITYFGDNNHKKTPWKKYEKYYLPMKR